MWRPQSHPQPPSRMRRTRHLSMREEMGGCGPDPESSAPLAFIPRVAADDAMRSGRDLLGSRSRDHPLCRRPGWVAAAVEMKPRACSQWAAMRRLTQILCVMQRVPLAALLDRAVASITGSSQPAHPTHAPPPAPGRSGPNDHPKVGIAMATTTQGGRGPHQGSCSHARGCKARSM